MEYFVEHKYFNISRPSGRLDVGTVENISQYFDMVVFLRLRDRHLEALILKMKSMKHVFSDAQSGLKTGGSWVPVPRSPLLRKRP
jgi:hypothetical protein